MKIAVTHTVTRAMLTAALYQIMQLRGTTKGHAKREVESQVRVLLIVLGGEDRGNWIALYDSIAAEAKTSRENEVYLKAAEVKVREKWPDVLN